MPWILTLIGPDPIIGRRGLKAALPIQRKNPRTSATRWNVSNATRRVIFSATAPTRTLIKERSQ